MLKSWNVEKLSGYCVIGGSPLWTLLLQHNWHKSQITDNWVIVTILFDKKANFSLDMN